MGIFNVAYDLVNAKNYNRLFEGLKKTCSGYAHVLGSTWLVSYPGTSLQLANALVKFMDSDDRLLVTGVEPGTTAWRGIPKEVVDWINTSRAA